MPLYDMQCTCGHRFEARRSMAEGPPQRCPSCKKHQLKQIFDKPPAFHTYYSPMHPRAKRGRGH